MPTCTRIPYKRALRGFVLGLALAAGEASRADNHPDTLTQIGKTGRIALGVRDATAPLSYLDASGRHIGYHADVCNKLAEAVRIQLELPTIKIVTVPTSTATRFALLNNNTVDIDCTHNPIKASALSQALFSHATMVSEVRLVTTVNHPNLRLDSLGGRTIGLVAGGSSVGALRVLARRKGFTYKESFSKLPTELFEQLVQGRADALLMVAPYAMALRALSADPARYRLVEGVLQSEPIALMFRLGDERLQALANETLARMMKSGEMTRLYEKWFMQPIPGLPIPVGVPLPPVLEGWFQHPGTEMQQL